VSIAAVRREEGREWQAAAAGDAGVVAPAGGEAYVRLRLETPVVVTRGDRFVLRALSPAATIGGGTILDPQPPAGGLRRASTLPRFTALESDEGAIEAWTRTAAGRGLPVDTLIGRGGLSRMDSDRLARAGIDAERLWIAGDRLFAPEIAIALRDDAQRELGRFHAAHQDEPGMPREQLRDRVARRIAPVLFDFILTQMTEAHIVRGTERVALVTHRPALSPADAAARKQAFVAVKAAGLAGADVAVLTGALGDARAVDRIVRLLIRDHEVVKIGNLYFDAAALARLKSDVQALKTPAAGTPVQLDVGTFKTKFGLTRRSAIPLLEWLDRERVTRRTGETRVVL
jgi:selenocysteine-specific elongation factor